MELEKLFIHFTKKCFRKGDFLVREGEICHHVYFINHGLVKLYSCSETREFVMRFFADRNFVTVFNSFTECIPSHFQLKALEDTEVLMLHRDKMEEICDGDHAIEKYFRKLTQWTASKMVSRLTEMLENDATTRYEIFQKNNAELMQRLHLGDIASYLGITQASLSKIRGKR